MACCHPSTKHQRTLFRQRTESLGVPLNYNTGWFYVLLRLVSYLRILLDNAYTTNVHI